MGFFKKLLIEKESNKLRLGEMSCRYCGYDDLKFTKHIGYGYKMGIVYHYKAYCLSCDKIYYIKRSRNIYKKVINNLWVKSKSYKEKERKENFFKAS